MVLLDKIPAFTENGLVATVFNGDGGVSRFQFGFQKFRGHRLRKPLFARFAFSFQAAIKNLTSAPRSTREQAWPDEPMDRSPRN